MSCSSCPPTEKNEKGKKVSLGSKIVRVATGFRYLAAGINEELSQKRLKVCYNCPRLMGGMVCSICGCEVHAKTRLPEEKCPETKPGPRWLEQTI